ncbi:MAG: MOSC domain-containing protein [Croceibacterium sp.]
MAGRLAGIAHHGRKYAAMETLERVAVSVAAGVAGDHASAVASAKSRPRRQVSLIERGGWRAALAELGGTLEWWHSRRNFLIEDTGLPHAAGTRLQLGARLVIEITGECAPCQRMDALLPGLNDAMKPDWRGGFVGRVVRDGEVAVGDEIRIL